METNAEEWAFQVFLSAIVAHSLHFGFVWGMYWTLLVLYWDEVIVFKHI